MDGWKTSFLFGRLPVRYELLVLGGFCWFWYFLTALVCEACPRQFRWLYALFVPLIIFEAGCTVEYCQESCFKRFWGNVTVRICKSIDWGCFSRGKDVFPQNGQNRQEAENVRTNFAPRVCPKLLYFFSMADTSFQCVDNGVAPG